MQVSHIGLLKSQGHGLGNQLFLIASTIGIAMDHNLRYGFSNWKNNTYFANKLPGLAPGPSVIVKEKSFDYNPVELPVNTFVYLDGYFQSDKYFNKVEDKIRDVFQFNFTLVDEVKNVLNQIDLSTTCSIHVRRGDYLNYPNIHPQQPQDYWFSAQKEIEEHAEVKTYIVFSDDIPWCKQNKDLFNRTGKKVLFLQGRTQIDDFIGISLCKNNIITNSTFSWWAAWLNNNSDKVIVMPKLWFGSKGPSDGKDLVVEGWIQK